MKKMLFIILLGIFSLNINANNWHTSFEEAKKMALITNKLLLVDFSAVWCGPCKRMDSESWSKEDVKLLMANYVPVKIDIDRYRDLAQKYRVKGIPYIFIMDANGKVIYQQMSYKKKSEVISLLKKYALDTTFLSQELINYYKKINFSNAFRLASKYQDFSIYIDSKLKRDFLVVANEYFNDTKKHLKKSDFRNKKGLLQKIEFLKIKEKLILDKPKKALKLLSKIDEEKVDTINRSLYVFLNYTVNMKLKNIKKADLWKTNLSEKDLHKSELILNSF